VRHRKYVNASVCIAVSIVALCLGLGLTSPGSAMARSFGEPGEEVGQLGVVRSIAVNQESGVVYIADGGNKRITAWSAGGEFLFAWGWGVASGAAELQTCGPAAPSGDAECRAGLEGGSGGQLSGFAAGGLAVDNDPLSPTHGNIYVADTGNERVDEFEPDGKFVVAFGGDVNASTTGDICLVGEECQAGKLGIGHGEFELPASQAIAVDPSGMVYVGDHKRIQEFKAGGAFVKELALPEANEITQLAVDSTGDIYVMASGLTGVHKYDGAGVEEGEPRDPSANEPADIFDTRIAIGPSDSLLVEDDAVEAGRHVLEYAASGNKTAVFVDQGAVDGTDALAYGTAENVVYTSHMEAIWVSPVPVPGPFVIAEASSEVLPTKATVSATINPEGAATKYHFVYGTTTSYGFNSPEAVLPGEAFEDEQANAVLEGLLPRTTYHYRVVATNANGTADGPDETFTTDPPALIDEAAPVEVSSSNARFSLRVNPLGEPTRYRLEYGQTPAYGTTVPSPEGQIAAGLGDVVLPAINLQDLSADTVYHYRVIATNAFGVVESPDHTFRTQRVEAGQLPDGRAWEMVSPPNKGGSALEGMSGEGSAIQAAADGHAIAYVASASINGEAQGNRSVAFSELLSRRTANGWSSQDIATAHEAPAGYEAGEQSEYRLFSTDLSQGLVEPAGETPLSEQATEKTPYLRQENGEFLPLLTSSDVADAVAFGGRHLFAAATPDLKHILLATPADLTLPAFAGNGKNESIYEWSNGALSLVSVLPNGEPAAEAGDESAVGAEGRIVSQAMSSDGRRVVFTTTNSGTQHLLMRDTQLDGTVQLDTVAGGATGGAGEPQFQGASTDDSKIYFTDQSRLTSNATSKASAPDLYLCEVHELTCDLTDVTVDSHAHESANVQGLVLGVSETGSRVFYVATGALSEVEDSAGEHAAAGRGNLYEFDAESKATRLVAVLSGGDTPDWGISATSKENVVGTTSRISPDGRYLAFMSEESLTGYDNADRHSGVRDQEVFLYDSSTGKLACASCNPTGARPEGVFDPEEFPGLLVDRPKIWQERWLAGSIPSWTPTENARSLYQSRYLSNSGRLFFNSPDALVPEDGNGQEDVYEFEPAGTGSCSEASATFSATDGGCVGLISSGTSSEESTFMDASEDGSDVFFLTASQLASQDVDGALDLYDARVCTAAEPCSGAVVAHPPGCVTAESCRAAAPAQPEIFGAPASATLRAPGNQPPESASTKPVSTKRTTRAQKLVGALDSCRKLKPRQRRVACERQARRRFGKAGSSQRKQQRHRGHKSTKNKRGAE
jgi:Tol biopolymer transport system component